MSTISAFDKVLDEVSDKGINGFIQTLNTYEAGGKGSCRGRFMESKVVFIGAAEDDRQSRGKERAIRRLDWV